MSVTIRDVARKAGVSVATVSRVLNETGYVKEVTRRRVLDAVRELGYSPSHLARSLSHGRTGTIGAVFPDISNPFFPSLARGIDDVLAGSGYLLVICNTDDEPSQEARVVEGLLEKRVDGIVFASGSPCAGEAADRAARAVPVCWIDGETEEASCDSVTCDNRKGAYEMTLHLLEQGHRRIAFVSGPEDSAVSGRRLEGFRACLKDSGVEEEPRVYWGDFTYEAGYSMGREILSSMRGITAVFAADDLMALGVERCFTESGVAVPSRMAVAGFDDIPMAALSRPSLTTVARPAYRMGALAAEMLLERLGRGKEARDGPRRVEVLEPVVVVRDSTGGGR